MRLLVTGANGQIGWELRRSLAAIGDVIAVDRNACDLSRPHDLPGLIDGPGQAFVPSQGAQILHCR